MKNWIGLLLTIALIIAALSLQFIYHLNPCPLCIMQRIALIGIGLLFFIFAFLPKKLTFKRIQGILLILTSLAGFAIALRQIYLQHLPPDQVPACGPGLDYLLQTFPWLQALSMVLQGSGECATVNWRFLGFSMATWSAVWLLFFCLWGFYLLRLNKKSL